MKLEGEGTCDEATNEIIKNLSSVPCSGCVPSSVYETEKLKGASDQAIVAKYRAESCK